MNRHSLRLARRRIPFFPVIPLVPLAIMLANVTALFTLLRQMRRVESRLQAH